MNVMHSVIYKGIEGVVLPSIPLYMDLAGASPFIAAVDEYDAQCDLLSCIVGSDQIFVHSCYMVVKCHGHFLLPTVTWLWFVCTFSRSLKTWRSALACGADCDLLRGAGGMSGAFLRWQQHSALKSASLLMLMTWLAMFR